MTLKVMAIIGTRPELIKLSRVLNEFDKYTNLIIVHTGQNYDYELNEIFFKELDIRKPQYFLNTADSSPAKTIANVISQSDEIFLKEQPDALLIYGDTNSCLSVISAKRRKIPIFHMEAGNRCFDLRVPEEINRKIVDHLSDINMVHSEHARRYLIAEGIKAETIIKTGTPMREILDYFSHNISNSTILSKLSLNPGEYFVISTHREENIDSIENLENLIDTLNSLATKYNKRIIFSTHPRTMKKLEEKNFLSILDKKIEILKPLGFFDYIKLQQSSFCVLSDSGTITEEASLLSIPAIMIRETHERPEGMDCATVIMSGLKKERILEAIEVLIDQKNRNEHMMPIEDYKSSKYSAQV